MKKLALAVIGVLPFGGAVIPLAVGNIGNIRVR